MRRRFMIAVVTIAAVTALAGCVPPPPSAGPTCVPAFDGRRSFSYLGPENTAGNTILFADSPSCGGGETFVATMVTAPTPEAALQLCLDLGAGLNALDLSRSFWLPLWLRPLYGCL